MSTANSNKNQSEYDKIIQQIDIKGVFQTRFAITFVSVMSFLSALQYMNKIISLTVPDHWCHVPGRDNTNYTLEEWRNITIPMEMNIHGIYTYSKCTRFANVLHRNEIVKCDHGWNYDQTWYNRTATMQNNWVCDDNMIPTNVLAINRAAEVIGTIIFGQAADNYGRMPIFFLSLITIFLGRLTTVFTSSWVYIFYIFSFISSLACSTIFHSPYIIAMEISKVENRAFVSMLLGNGWSLGVTISPLLMWWQRNWTPYSLISILPIGIYLILYRWMIESPRWLASRGKNKRCVKVLSKIARTNQTLLSDNIQKRLIGVQIEENDTKVYTIISLFSSRRLTKNIIILIYGTATPIFIYMCLIISANNLDGNPYLNYLFLGLIDLPAYPASKYFCDRYGRRLMAFVSILVMFLGCLTMAIVVQDPSKTIVMTIAFILTKGSASMVFAAANLQVIEISPTCIRQTSISFVAIVANCFCVLGPYVVALGTSVNIKIPYIIYTCGALVALVSCIFLPETLDHQLPDTLKDAAEFGANQDLWWRIKMRNGKLQNEVEVPLNTNP